MLVIHEPSSRVLCPAAAADVLGRLKLHFGNSVVDYHKSDAATGGNLPPREAWAAFRQLPLTDEEFRTIAANVAPYLR